MNGKKIAVLIVGILLTVIGLVVVIADVNAALAQKAPDGTIRLVLYVGLGAATVGAYLIDPAWLSAFIDKVRSYLPGGTPPSSS